MQISFATANFYFTPFEEALDIITSSGFQNIELDLPWEWKQWNMAQHLKNIPVAQAVQAILRSGLKVTSIHDGGGVLNDYKSTENYINPCLDEYLDQLGYAPEYMVFHPPHAEGNHCAEWWDQISGDILRSLEPYRSMCNCLTLENMPFFDGFTVPLTTPEALHAFAVQNELGINVDTTHYAQIGVDLLEAARILQGSTCSVHLSDYAAGRAHAFIGEGELDLAGFLGLLNPAFLSTVTLECSVSSPGRSDRDMTHAEMVERMKLLKIAVEYLLNGKYEHRLPDTGI